MANDDSVVSMDIRGLDEAVAMLRKLPPELRDKAIKTALRAGARTVSRDVKERIPVRMDTRPRMIMGKSVMPGELKRSVRVSMPKRAQSHDWMRAKVLVGNKTAWYAHIVDQGAKAHVIKARNKQLFFGGKRYKSVNHPGFTGLGFMRAAATASFNAAVETARKVFNRAVDRIGKKS